MRSLGYIFIISIILSCGINKKSTLNKKKDIIISLERTPCYGSCPIYKMSIYSDGTALYYGKRFVNKIGSYSFRVSKETIEYILNKAIEINFFQLEDQYTENISDLPKTITYIKNGKEKKKIVNYYGAPKKLREFESLVDGCIDYRKMIKIED